MTHLPHLLDEVNKKIEETSFDMKEEEVGVIQQVNQVVVRAKGLPAASYGELIHFDNGATGMVMNLSSDGVEIALLDAPESLQAGGLVRRTGKQVEIPVGPNLLGRVVDPLGRPLDDENNPIEAAEYYPVEKPAPSLMARKAVSVPLQTGIKAIDALIPIGRGQRELILGDRQTGKTAIALDAMINQKDTDVICIYCAIGQRLTSLTHLIQDLKKYGNFANVITVVAEGNVPPGLQYIAPYAATSMGEYFMEKEQKDVLIIYDNLTVHAEAYRQLSLFLRRPPGREAYPGDIFYIHSRLLERATRLKEGGSLTALPICETLAQNVAAYIPTNLISITDGQIFLSNSMFQKGLMPAIDIGISVSRVGGKAQRPVYKKFAGDLKLAYNQFQELEAFSKFGTQLDKETLSQLTRGERVRQILKQRQYRPLPAPIQEVIILAVTSGLLDPIPLDKVAEGEHLIFNHFKDYELTEDKKEECIKKLKEILSPLYENDEHKEGEEKSVKPPEETKDKKREETSEDVLNESIDEEKTSESENNKKSFPGKVHIKQEEDDDVKLLSDEDVKNLMGDEEKTEDTEMMQDLKENDGND